MVVIVNDDEYSINLDEIGFIVFDDVRCFVTIKLIQKLVTANIGILLCGDNGIPIGSILSLNSHSRTA